VGALFNHRGPREHSVGRTGWGLAAFAVLPFLFAFSQEPEKKPPAPLKVAPRAYFTAHCQRCHGIDGSNFVPGFAKDKPLETLRADIVRMAEGPGGAPLKPEDVEVQVAYHQLISAERPFVSWTSREGRVLKGEVADGAKLTANVGTVVVDDDFVWTLTLPSEADFAKLELKATMGKKETALVPSETAFAKPEEPKAGLPDAEGV
jgi:mono/diheme cytochrome c family protein